MKLNVKFIAVLLGASLFCSLITLANVLGQNKALEDRNRIILNVACSLDADDFKATLDSLSQPGELKQLFPDDHSAVWEQIKEQLYYQCYDEVSQ